MHDPVVCVKFCKNVLADLVVFLQVHSFVRFLRRHPSVAATLRSRRRAVVLQRALGRHLAVPGGEQVARLTDGQRVGEVIDKRLHRRRKRRIGVAG